MFTFYFCRSEDKRNLGVFVSLFSLNIIFERLGTEVGSFYEHCTVECLFVLLARMLPIPGMLPKVTSRGNRVFLTAPEPNYVRYLF